MCPADVLCSYDPACSLVLLTVYVSWGIVFARSPHLIHVWWRKLIEHVARPARGRRQLADQTEAPPLALPSLQFSTLGRLLLRAFGVLLLVSAGARVFVLLCPIATGLFGRLRGAP